MKGVDKDSHLVSCKPCLSSSVLGDRGVWGGGLGALCIDTCAQGELGEGSTHTNKKENI